MRAKVQCTPPTHYLIRMVHSERWSPSLCLNEEGWSRLSVSHPFELLPSTDAWIWATWPLRQNITPLYMAAGCRTDSLMNSCAFQPVIRAHLKLNHAPIMCSHLLRRVQGVRLFTSQTHLVLTGWKMSRVVWISSSFWVIEKLILMSWEPSYDFFSLFCLNSL